MSKIEPPFKFLLKVLKNGDLVPFLGAGASLRPVSSAKGRIKENLLPAASELTQHLAESTNFPKHEPQDLLKVAQYAEMMLLRRNLNGQLDDIFSKDYEPLKVHHFLASLQQTKLIITTNYDNLIEKAFIQAGKPYHLIIHTMDIETYGDKLLYFPHGEDMRTEANDNLYIEDNSIPVIYKMHGSAYHDKSSAEKFDSQYVITEEDYLNFLVRLTRTSAIPNILRRYMHQRGFLFLGYGLNDWNLRVVLSQLDHTLDSKRQDEVKSYAIQWKPSEVETLFWSRRRNVEIFDMDLNKFVSELERIERKHI